MSLTAPISDGEEYLGIDGKGILHPVYGTGEYLDNSCIRRARLVSGPDATNPLPLWCLKLDGFVVDRLPFQHELSHIVLLTCAKNCIDAGLRAPKTGRPQSKWSVLVNNAVTHCMIKFPSWTGIFDADGSQLNKDGLPYRSTVEAGRARRCFDGWERRIGIWI